MTTWRTILAMTTVVLPSLGIAAGFDATVSFARKVELGVPVSGIVKSVSVEAGAHVKRGEVLLALDNTPFRAGVEQAEAEMSRRTADRDEAARDLKQAQELYERTVLSTVEIENARFKATRAEAAFRAARARLAQARFSLAQSAIAAPFDGWVLDVRVQAGQSVVSNLEARALIVLAADGEYLARSLVPGAVLDALRLGQAATVSVKGKSYPGLVHALKLEPTVGKGGNDALYEISVAFRTTETGLRSGLPARIELP
jgi:RND family efflux transporter MFP subunit